MGGKAVVLATPEIAGLPYVISGLVAAGGLAAAMSTADGLILAIANAISHDVYYKMVDPKAETAKRLVVARVFLVIIGFAGATIAAMEIHGSPLLQLLLLQNQLLQGIPLLQLVS